MRLFILLAVALLCAWPSHAETGFLDRSVTMNGETYRFVVYVPADYTSQKKWPLITYLHGNGNQGNDGFRPIVNGLGNFIRQDRSRFPVIALFPQCALGKSWVYRDMQDLVMIEIEKVLSEFAIDSTRTYLAGHSNGGEGVYRIAYRWPNAFAALLATAGSVQIPPRNIHVAVDRQENEFLTSPDPYLTLATTLKDLPIRFLHGDADAVISVNESRKLNNAFKKVNAKAQYTEVPGADHGGSRDKAWSDPEFLNWLLAQHK